MSNRNIFVPGRIKYAVYLCVLLSFCFQAKAQQATWIWYPGDFEIALSNQMQNRRTERGAFSPVFWKMDTHYNLVLFAK